MGEVKKILKINKEIVTDILCDCCGESCMTQEFKIDGNTARSFEYMRLSADWGYDSNKDLEKWEAFLCEKCVDEKLLFIKFKKTELKFRTIIQ